jgi:hypothetical protein
MLSLQDCIDLCDLTEAEIEAIAEHEHIPTVVAVELAEYLVETADGGRRIRAMIKDDIEHALAHGNRAHAAALVKALRHFIDTHPDRASVG